MGLDMYLTKEIYIGADYEHNKITGTVEIFSHTTPILVNLNKIRSITELVGYWRKANQIHHWFVRNIQEGVDDCKLYGVSHKQLIELEELCVKALSSNDASLLPPINGFFFGNTEIDAFYWQGIQETIDILSDLPSDGNYYYRSSW